MNQRIEYRFELNRSYFRKNIGYGLGGVSSFLLGAALYLLWRQFSGASEGVEWSFPLLVLGLMLGGGAWWSLKGSKPLAIRVGDGGVAYEKGGFQRIPWYSITQIVWDPHQKSINVYGFSEEGSQTLILIRVEESPEAVSFLLQEARRRVPVAVQLQDADIASEVKGRGIEGHPPLLMEPIQVVGKPCAASGRLISYEPDARVCLSCGRIYHFTRVPSFCVCQGVEALRA
ncbi:hypothetical protein [Pajaroellobacter abortibovis]|uniref:Uncharacterized protein n=1 Tax=Pajaroellobacter abortibovis TaxID=1882918 RepID=A0A1L6MV27_9BACT|nr:hypothetical protein [Pajaroellobacter abortibovis]APR99331.1 hypothetical protein BCY86_00545 [Pajaroellobacter abortibovis]